MLDIKELLIVKGRENQVIDPEKSLKKMMEHVETRSVEAAGITMLRIRDALLGLGRILEENEEEQYYLTTVNTGAGAVLLAQISGDRVEIAAYAKEGMISQHSAKKAIEKVIQKLLPAGI